MAWLPLFNRGDNDVELLPDIFPIPINETEFLRIDVRNTYRRILTDAFERTEGLSEQIRPLLWDNCLGSENQHGLISMIAHAMAAMADLFIVYDKALKVVRKATGQEQEKIRTDYLKMGESTIGMYITFRHYERTRMVEFYSLLEYGTVGGLWKASNVSRAIQLKFNDLRNTTGLGDSGDVKAQMKKLAEGLSKGCAVGMDAKDSVTTTAPDLTAIDAAMEFLCEKKSNYLGMPSSYFTGEQSNGLGDSGQADLKATERGLKAYYFSIAKPVSEKLFGASVTFRSDNSESLDTALNVLKTMDLTSQDYMSADNKTKVVNKAFGFDEDEVGDPPSKDQPANPAANTTTPPFQANQPGKGGSQPNGSYP